VTILGRVEIVTAWIMQMRCHNGFVDDEFYVINRFVGDLRPCMIWYQ
jgi:hypothetical protein